MNKLKKALGLGLALAMLSLSVIPVASHALVIESATVVNKFPPVSGGYAQDLMFTGLKPLRLSGTTAATLLHSGPLFLDAICVSGGTLGKYSLALDSGANAAGLTFDSITIASSPNVYIDSASQGALGALGKNMCWEPKAPIKLVNGLVGVANNAGHQTLFYVHCSDGSNPCVP